MMDSTTTIELNHHAHHLNHHLNHTFGVAVEGAFKKLKVEPGLIVSSSSSLSSPLTSSSSLTTTITPTTTSTTSTPSSASSSSSTGSGNGNGGHHHGHHLNLNHSINHSLNHSLNHNHNHHNSQYFSSFVVDDQGSVSPQPVGVDSVSGSLQGSGVGSHQSSLFSFSASASNEIAGNAIFNGFLDRLCLITVVILIVGNLMLGSFTFIEGNLTPTFTLRPESTLKGNTVTIKAKIMMQGDTTDIFKGAATGFLANPTPQTTAAAPSAFTIPLGNMTTPSTTSFTFPQATPSSAAPPTTTATFSLPIASSSLPTASSTFTIPLQTSTTAPTTTVSSLIPQLKPTTGTQKMTFAKLEDTINKWLDELTGLENDFHEQAENINVWDSILINNANKLSQINEKLDQLKSENTKINNQIDFIQSQQTELEELIKPLEAEKFKLMEGEGISEKDRFYNTIESVNNDLQGIALDIQAVIEQFNATNTIKDVNDPLASIGKILNLHMTLLKHIDEQLGTIQFPDYSRKTLNN
ncbi:nuclear pore glycoprotein p62-like [Panonychus citri]|uniref:nuclear pore glycoprotein p62-like n=1 Tax=Panonychus citri TaxID=50023 RepID=UPI0023071C38|nr:nuclear pore glycoprotein p62-like [Panonychus citri]